MTAPVDQTITDGNADETSGTEQQQATYTPPATQADLDRIISERVARTKAQFKDYTQLKAAADELAQIKAANQTEAERLSTELTRWQTEAETWRKAAVGNQIQALAAVDFEYPDDAITALGDTSKYLDAGGQIDQEAIKADLAALLEQRPNWRRQSADTPRLPAPNHAQGTSGRTASTPAEELGAFLRSQLR